MARHNVRVVQGWGLTETSPVAAVAQPPRNCPRDEEIEWTTKTGRVIPGVELRVCDGDTVLPWDGESIGELEVRGPWITGRITRIRRRIDFTTAGCGPAIWAWWTSGDMPGSPTGPRT